MKKIKKLIINISAIFSIAIPLCCRSPRASYEVARAEDYISFENACEESNLNEICVTLDSSNLKLNAKSAFSMDFETQTEIYSLNPNERLPIASMCKITTLLLCFEEIDEERLSLDEEIVVSERAASMGGSQVFLEANAKYKVKELLKSIAICSANDSCVALAERICGDELIFTDKMNERAKSLGANDTLYANCTGLPKEPQYSTAKDVAIILKELLKHEQYYEISKVWTDEFEHPKGRVTEISNTNKLIRFYEGCDGGKTGFTNQAGYCLAATAKRDDMRIISVVIGEKDSKTRFNDVKKTFDFAFANYTLAKVVDDNNPLEEKASVSGGKKKEFSVKPVRAGKVFTKRDDASQYVVQTIFKSDLKAPLKTGDRVGEIIVYKDGIEIDKIDLVAHENVEKASFFDKFRDVANGWLMK